MSHISICTDCVMPWMDRWERLTMAWAGRRECEICCEMKENGEHFHVSGQKLIDAIRVSRYPNASSVTVLGGTVIFGPPDPRIKATFGEDEPVEVTVVGGTHLPSASPEVQIYAGSDKGYDPNWHRDAWDNAHKRAQIEVMTKLAEQKDESL